MLPAGDSSGANRSGATLDLLKKANAQQLEMLGAPPPSYPLASHGYGMHHMHSGSSAMGSHYYEGGSWYAQHHTQENGIFNHKSDGKSNEA